MFVISSITVLRNKIRKSEYFKINFSKFNSYTELGEKIAPSKLDEFKK